MCVFTRSSKPTIAEEPIRVYKIVIKQEVGEGKFDYLSYFSFVPTVHYVLGACVEMKELYDPRPEVQRIFSDPDPTIPYFDTTCNEKWYEVNLGLCTFDPEVDDWKNVARWMAKSEEECEVVVLECEIPKGARYYKGFSNCCGKESAYASDYLLPLRELDKSVWQ